MDVPTYDKITFHSPTIFGKISPQFWLAERMDAWVYMSSGVYKPTPSGHLHVLADGHIIESARRWQWTSTTLSRIAHQVLTDPRFLLNKDAEDFLMSGSEGLAIDLQQREEPLEKINKAAQTLAQRAGTQRALTAATELDQACQNAKQFTGRMIWLRSVLARVDALACADASRWSLLTSIASIDKLGKEIHADAVQPAPCFSQAWNDALDYVDIDLQATRKLCLEELHSAILCDFLKLVDPSAEHLTRKSAPAKLTLMSDRRFEGVIGLSCLTLSDAGVRKLKGLLTDVDAMDLEERGPGADLPGLISYILDTRWELRYPDSATNKLYAKHLGKSSYQEMQQAAEIMSPPTKDFYLLRICHHGPARSLLSGEQLAQLERLDHHLRFVRRAQALVGQGKLTRLLEDSFRSDCKPVQLLEHVANELVSGSTSDPSVALYLDVLLLLARECHADQSFLASMQRRRTDYIRRMKQQDRCALGKLATLHRAHEPKDGLQLLRCGSEHLYVETVVIARLREWDSGMLGRLGQLSEHSFEPPIYSLEELQGKLLSTDGQMSPVLLSCLVQLIKNGSLPQEIAENYGEQLNAAVAWLHPVSPPLTWQQLYTGLE